MIDYRSVCHLEANNKFIESIASSLIREFLARKGLENVLKTLDVYLPRDSYSINNRAELIRLLQLQRLVVKNQNCESPVSTLLEIVTKQLLDPSGSKKVAGVQEDSVIIASASENAKEKASSEETLSLGSTFTENWSSGSAFLGGTFKKPVGLCAPNNSVVQLPSSSDHRNVDSFASEHKDEGKALLPIARRISSSTLTTDMSEPNDVEICDFSDSETGDLAPISPSRPIPKTTNRPILLSEACALKKLMFGSTSGGFSYEWRGQAFAFSHHPTVAYGLVQKKGGPCGLLSAVQAHVLRDLLFSENAISLENGRLRVTRETRSRALARSLAHILWQAGGKQKAVVVLPGKVQVLDCGTQMKTDGITETLSLTHFAMYSELENFLHYITPQLELDGNDGCIIILFSAVMSRGIDKVTTDMDDPSTNLVGRHGYCTQEMVSLILIGKAVSNVFDGNIELNTGGIDRLVLHGIPGPSDIGFLSLFEHYDSCKVGSFYKNSRYPIWVVLSESHFTVLFAVLGEIAREDVRTSFDLFYYDSLGHQEEEIWLTVDPLAGLEHLPNVSDLTPPLEHCIRTKWKGARVTWHGSDPLL